VFAFQKLWRAPRSPPRKRSILSASHARIHAFRSESPRSQGMSRVRPAASGHVRMSATPRYTSVALRGLMAEGLGLLVFSSESCNQIPNLIQLSGGCERDHPEIAVRRIHPETRTVDTQYAGGVDEVDDEIGVGLSGRQIDLRHRVERGARACGRDARDGVCPRVHQLRALAQGGAERRLMGPISLESRDSGALHRH